MALIPINDHLIIEPKLHSELFADEVKKRSGLLLDKPDNKNSFEGIPNMGIIYALPKSYTGHLNVGKIIIYNEPNPKGFKYEGLKLLTITFDQVIATIGGDN